MSLSSKSRLDYTNQGLTDPVSQRRLHNDGSCIFKTLPTEILRLIASDLALRVDDIWQEGPLDVTHKPTRNLAPGLDLSHTCSRWREVAINTPDIWTAVPLSYAEWTREFLRRSHPLPIIIFSGVNGDMLAKTASAEHLDRARFIYLEKQVTPAEGFPWLTHSTAPLLECMHIAFASHSQNQPTSLPGLFGGQEPPRLRELSISDAFLIQPSGLSIPFLWAHTIKSLSLLHCSIWRDVSDMVTTLSRVQGLEELRIEHSTVLNVLPAAWHNPDVVADIPIQLPHLKNLWLNLNVVPMVVVLRHIILPEALQTLSLKVVNDPVDNFAGLNALMRLPLSPIIHEIAQQPISSRKLTYFMENETFRIIASKPMQPDVMLSGYAGRRYVRDTQRGTVGGAFFSLEIGHQPLVVAGSSTSAIVATTVPSLFYVGSLTLDGESDAPLITSNHAWPGRLPFLRAAEYLEICRGGALGFVLQAEPSWLHRNRPATLCLRDVSLDMTIGIANTEPGQTMTFFELLMRKIAPWVESHSLKRIVVRQCPLQQWMLDELERVMGEDGVDWDHIVTGARMVNEGGD